MSKPVSPPLKRMKIFDDYLLARVTTQTEVSTPFTAWPGVQASACEVRRAVMQIQTEICTPAT